jgi:hypothetical protein
MVLIEASGQSTPYHIVTNFPLSGPNAVDLVAGDEHRKNEANGAILDKQEMRISISPMTSLDIGERRIPITAVEPSPELRRGVQFLSTVATVATPT